MGLLAQLAEYCSANAEAMGSNPFEVPNLFFRFNLQLLDLQSHYDDHDIAQIKYANSLKLV